jgi:hypothetical protein
VRALSKNLRGHLFVQQEQSRHLVDEASSLLATARSRLQLWRSLKTEMNSTNLRSRALTTWTRQLLDRGSSHTSKVCENMESSEKLAVASKTLSHHLWTRQTRASRQPTPICKGRQVPTRPARINRCSVTQRRTQKQVFSPA